MSNSKLTEYILISPNSTNPRNKPITKITIHHMAGNFSLENCGKGFSDPKRKASANYGIDSMGRVGMFVEEKNRSWASSNAANDNAAVTIEVANDVSGNDWHVSDKALNKTIELCADICVRNGIKKLNFTSDKKGNLTMHKYFAATLCPGPYLESKFPYIADEVNKILSKEKKISKINLSTPNDIIWELSQRGIILDKDLWLKKCTVGSNAYFLCMKIANNTVNDNERKNKLESVNDIVWELNKRNILTDKTLWLSLLEKDEDLYHLAYKCANKTKNGGK